MALHWTWDFLYSIDLAAAVHWQATNFQSDSSIIWWSSIKQPTLEVSLQYCCSRSATDTAVCLSCSAKAVALCISNEANANGLQQGVMLQDCFTCIVGGQRIPRPAPAVTHQGTQCIAVYFDKILESCCYRKCSEYVVISWLCCRLLRLHEQHQGSKRSSCRVKFQRTQLRCMGHDILVLTLQTSLGRQAAESLLYTMPGSTLW